MRFCMLKSIVYQLIVKIGSTEMFFMLTKNCFQLKIVQNIHMEKRENNAVKKQFLSIAKIIF